MSQRDFKFDISPVQHARIKNDWQSIVLKAADHDIYIQPTGQFSGGFSGQVRISEKEVDITITDKPFLVPWPLVESKLRELFAS